MREAFHFYATVRRWPRFDIQIIPELLLNNRKKLIESLKWLLKSHIKDIILFCGQKDLANILNEVQKKQLKFRHFKKLFVRVEVTVMLI